MRCYSVRFYMRYSLRCVYVLFMRYLLRFNITIFNRYLLRFKICVLIFVVIYFVYLWRYVHHVTIDF